MRTVPAYDTARFINSVTGTDSIATIEVSRSVPIELNGKRIYSINEVKKSRKFDNSVISLESYLLNGAINISGLKTINYDCRTQILLSKIVIDESGEIVYYDFGGIICLGADDRSRNICSDEAMEKLIRDAPLINPVNVNGKRIPILLNINMANYGIEKKGAKITCKGYKIYEH